MDTVQIVLGILLLISAVFLIVAVLMQNGKSHGLSGAITGGAETFFGKQKGSTIEKRLSKITTVVAVIFIIIVLVIYIRQDQTDFDKLQEDYMNSLSTGASTDETGDAETGDAETGDAAGTEAAVGTEAATE